jgi:RNA polymerase sigma-70 factor, ECF subfamily
MDEELQAITRLKQGDLGGLEALVRQYQVLAVHTAYLIVADRALAEDTVQSAFLKVAEKIDRYDVRRPFRPWFLRMVVNDSIKAARRQQRSLSLDAPSGVILAWLTDPAPGPEQQAETDDLRLAVWSALQQLTPEQRAVIIQRHFLGMDEADMVRELQRPPSTIKWWLHTARERLKTLLGPDRAERFPFRPQTPGGKHEKR